MGTTHVHCGQRAGRGFRLPIWAAVIILAGGSWGTLSAVSAAVSTRPKRPFDVPLKNPSFTDGVDRNSTPTGWSKYGGHGTEQRLSIATGPDNRTALLIVDGDRASEIGVFQTVSAKGGETYRVSVMARAVDGATVAGAHLQMRFLPSNRLVQKSLNARSTKTFSEVSVTGTAPPDTTKCVIYLYTHAAPTPQVMVTNVKLVGGLPPPPLPAPPPPAPVPPQYAKLKKPYLNIALVEEGQARIIIVVPRSGIHDTAARTIQRVIESRTSVKVPIVSDDSPDAAVPIRGNLIVLGNRSTNKTLNALYDLYYCLVDLKYPGIEGYVIRSVHNPFGNGSSVVVIGGSDAIGVRLGAEKFADILTQQPSRARGLSIGWTMETKLGKGITPPSDVEDFETWEASRGYGSMGYFGWCSISKQMAMYYMTGNEANAREFVRLAFPDEQAIRDIERIDGERIENKHDPLAGFYHYNAHMAILFWDLIEESPVFSDTERLKITNAFARQLNHRKGEGVYGLTRPRRAVGTRHGQWSAISLYCLGRYFDKYYPNPIWAQCERAGKLAFESLHDYAWVAGESDNLFWYSTGIAPIFTYMVLTGDRKPLENGVMEKLLLGQQALLSGRKNDSALRSASIGMLNKAAYLTGDGRWITYRGRTGVDTNTFRLGQSFWPDTTLKPAAPTDLAGRWTVYRLSEPAWDARGSGLPFDDSFYFGSYRSGPDASGDFILLDGFNGASRNPYHTFDILQLRLDGRTILDGYHNQVVTSADGMVEPVVAMDAALQYADVVGSTAMAVGEVPEAAFCNWRRAIVQRTGRYVLVVDDLAFRTSSQNMNVTTTWQIPGGHWDTKQRVIRLLPTKSDPVTGFQLQSCDPQQVRGGRVVTMDWHGAVNKGDRRLAFYLICRETPGVKGRLICARVATNAAALALPEPALAVVGQFARMKGELTVLSENHLVGHALRNAGIERVLITSDMPVDIDWDFPSGVAHVVTTGQTKLVVNLVASNKVRLNGQAIETRHGGTLCTIDLPPGRHLLTGLSPPPDVCTELSRSLIGLLTGGQQQRLATPQRTERPSAANAAVLPVAMTVHVNSPVSDMIVVRSAHAMQLAVAEGKAVHLFDFGGTETRQLQADGNVRRLRWWDEPQLLLAGCVDEQVIAFDTRGQRKWTFRSEMDPAVYRAAKTYWFKTAPGHEGIHGLYTGPFDNGADRCFVGSACTLEILDQNGSLLKRTPVFWGPGRKFLLVDGPDGGKNLLVSRWPNGNDRLAVVSSKTMTVTGQGYQEVPAGHSYVGGWAAQNKTDLVRKDLDGDGKREIVTVTNGTWNRVTVYSESGKPLFNAQFGPGASSSPRSRMRDMDIADLDGDGKQEIIVGLSEGLVVVLNHACQKVFSTRLASPPRSLRAVQGVGGKRPWIIIGCDDGSVVALDERGQPVGTGHVRGRPDHIVTVQTAAGPAAVLATDQGDVKMFLRSDTSF